MEKEIANQYENYNSAIEFSSIPKTKALPELENPSAFFRSNQFIFKFIVIKQFTVNCDMVSLSENVL